MSATQQLLRFGIFELNLDTAELCKSGKLVKLQPQPFQLLAILASHAGQVVAHDAIQMQLWSVNSEVDFEHGVRQCIAQIRTALGDSADKPRFVETVPRQGYRFIAPVTSKTIVEPSPQVKESSSSGIESAIAARVLAKITASGATGAAAGAAEAVATAMPEDSPIRVSSRRRARRVMLAVGLVVVIALVVGSLLWRAHKFPVLTDFWR